MNPKLNQALQDYGQAQFQLGVATLRLELLLTQPTPAVEQEPEPVTEQ